LQAAIAMTVLGYTLSFCYLGNMCQLWLYGLLLLSLPVIPPMQLYLGYPLRVIIAKLSAILLQLSGWLIVREGTALIWPGGTLWIDASCSGIRKLWTGLYLALTLAALYEIGIKKTLWIIGFTLCAIAAGNTLRVTALFFAETGIGAIPSWVHDGVGLVAFLFAAMAIAWFTRHIQRELSCSSLQLTIKE
jgi:exosortase